MATGKPDSRQTHVTRIFGTNRKDERLDYIWADVERADVVKSALQVPPDMQWQGVQRRLRWSDDPNSDDYAPDGTPSRKVDILKVCDPESQDVNDPDEWIPVKVIKGLRMRVETGTEDNGGTAQERFLASVTTDELTTARVIEVRRTVHCDTNIDNDAQAAFDAGQKEYVVSSDNYIKDAGTKDTTRYVEQEIITYLKHKGNANDVMGLARQTKLLNSYLIEASETATQDIVGAHGFNPPYRLDPYQSIININFRQIDQQWLLGWLVHLGPEPTTAPNAEAKDGFTWGKAKAGSTGMGFTVITAGTVAFGRILVGDSRQSCFMRADRRDTVVFVGTRNDQGHLVWRAAWTAPGQITAVSFANDAFFITYATSQNPDVDLEASKIAMTVDAVSFRASTPFGGNPAVSGCGSVAFIKDGRAGGVYVTNAGGADDSTDPFSKNDSLRWAYSLNGLSWTPHLEPSSYTGIGAPGKMRQSTIAAGNGVIVSVASKKNRFEQFFPDGTPETDPDYVLHSCAVAVSTTGTSFSLVPLPGAEVIGGLPGTLVGDRSGDGIAVAFIADKDFEAPGDIASADDNAAKITGYFVASGFEFGGNTRLPTAKMWVSVTGSSWSLVRTENEKIYTALSAITKHRDKTTVVIV